MIDRAASGLPKAYLQDLACHLLQIVQYLSTIRARLSFLEEDRMAFVPLKVTGAASRDS